MVQSNKSVYNRGDKVKDEELSSKEAAKLIGWSDAQLRMSRMDAPTFYKKGDGSVFYYRKDVELWMKKKGKITKGTKK